MALQDIKKSKKPRTKRYFERKADQKKAVQDYFKNKNKKETTDKAPGSEGYKPTKTDIGPFKKVDKNFKPKPVEGPEKFTFKPSQDAKLNKSNAPMPNFTMKLLPTLPTGLTCQILTTLACTASGVGSAMRTAASSSTSFAAS